MERRALQLGVIGAGRWGPNLLRCFLDLPDAEPRVVCDEDPERLRLLRERYPQLCIEADVAAVLRDPALDALVIATPTATHARLTRAALEAGKHVLVEKPLALSCEEADGLAELAAASGLVLMTGHVFLYNHAVRALKEVMRQDAFGGLRYMYARRTNLGPVRGDVHAGWDLAAHDVSIFLYLKEELPTEVTASAQTYIRRGVPDVVFATLYFADGTVAHLHTSWLDPQKVRQVVVVGGAQMLVFDDMNLAEPLRIYNKGWRAEHAPTEGEVADTFAAFRVILLSGDVVIPPVSTGEPLRQECEAFLAAVRDGRPPLSDGRLGADVVRVLAAIDRSIAADSRRVPV